MYKGKTRTEEKVVASDMRKRVKPHYHLRTENLH